MRAKVSLSALLTMALILSLLENINLLSWQEFLKPPEPDFAEKGYIHRAMKLRADEDKVPIETIMRMDTPTTMAFTDHLCVQLAPAPGVVGGHSITCFDNKTAKIVSDEEIGQ